jgi:hypothetical protein
MLHKALGGTYVSTMSRSLRRRLAVFLVLTAGIGACANRPHLGSQRARQGEWVIGASAFDDGVGPDGHHRRIYIQARAVPGEGPFAGFVGGWAREAHALERKLADILAQRHCGEAPAQLVRGRSDSNLNQHSHGSFLTYACRGSGQAPSKGALAETVERPEPTR